MKSLQTFSAKKLIVEYKEISTGYVYLIKDLPIKITIECAGLPSLDTANIQIYNLNQFLLNRLSFIQNRPLNRSRYSINVYSVENEQNRLVFAGDVVNAFPVYIQVPDVYLSIECQTGYNSAIETKTPLSLKGAVKVQEVVKNIATDLKKSFTNNGVDEVSENLYLEGSSIAQLNEISRNYNFTTIIDRNSIIISPKDKYTANTTIVVDCNSGLVDGYISNSQDGISLTTYYNSNYQLNGHLKIKNAINTICNGDWVVTKITHNLSSLINGEWNSSIKGAYVL